MNEFHVVYEFLIENIFLIFSVELSKKYPVHQLVSYKLIKQSSDVYPNGRLQKYIKKPNF